MKKKIMGLVLIMTLFAGMLGGFSVKAAGSSLKAVSLSRAEITVHPGDTYILSVLNAGENMKISWSSSDKKTAGVSSKGVITGVKAGTAVVAAQVTSGTKTKTFKCTVNVEDNEKRDGASVSVTDRVYADTVCVSEGEFSGTAILKYKITIPETVIADNAGASKKINKYFKELAEKEIKSAHELAETYSGDVQNEYFRDIMPYEYETTASLIYSNGNILCFSAGEYSNLGGPHPNHSASYVVFSMKTGKTVSINDIFTDKAKAVKAICSAMEAQIDEWDSLYGTDMRKDELFPDYAKTLKKGIKDGNWYIKEDRLYIRYNNSTIASYAAGDIDFVIPVSEFYKYISNTYKKALFSGNETAVINLVSNPSTGYSWSYTEGKSGYLEIIEKYTPAPSGKIPVSGAAGTQTFSARGLKKGLAAVTYRYLRSWEGKPAKTVKVIYYIDSELNTHIISKTVTEN